MAVEAKLEFIVGEFGDLVVDCGFPGIEGWSVSQLRKLEFKLTKYFCYCIINSGEYLPTGS